MDDQEQLFGAFLFAASSSAVGACAKRLIELGWTAEQINERKQELARAIAEIVGKSEPSAKIVEEFCEPFVAAGIRVANQIGGAK